MTKIISMVMIATTLSLSAYSEEVKLTGVIREVTCNNPSGLGFIELEMKNKRTLVKQALKVNSYELCGAAPGTFSRLGSIGYDALFLGETWIFEVIQNDGFVTEIRELEKIDYYKYFKNVKKYQYNNILEVNNWFLSGPAQIKFE